VFGPPLRDAALDLAGAGLSTATTGTTEETTPRFVVGLTKDAAFRAYTVDGASPASFTDLTVSIQAG
jgi:cyanophycinase